MDNTEIIIYANVFGIFLLPLALNRLRYTVPVTGKITNVGSYYSPSSEERNGNQYYIYLEYNAGQATIKKRIDVTEKTCRYYRTGQAIQLKVLPNNPYKSIIVKDHSFSAIKFFLIVIALIDIYAFLSSPLSILQ